MMKNETIITQEEIDMIIDEFEPLYIDGMEHEEVHEMYDIPCTGRCNNCDNQRLCPNAKVTETPIDVEWATQLIKRVVLTAVRIGCGTNNTLCVPYKYE